MRNLHRVNLAIISVIVGLLFLHPVKAISSGLRLNNQTGRLGERVEYTVWLEKSPRDVAAFGFELKYNSRVLRYLGSFYGGDLVRRFDFLDVSNPFPGTIRAGGFAAHGADVIWTDDSGTVLTLEFEVTGRSNTSLYFAALKDGFAGISTRRGEFTFAGPEEKSSTPSIGSGENSSISEIAEAGRQSTDQGIPYNPESKTSTPFGSMERQKGAEENTFGSAINPSTRWGSRGDGEKPQAMARVWEPSREIPYSNKEKARQAKAIDAPHGPPKSSISKRAHDSPSYGARSFKVKDIEGEKIDTKPNLFLGETVSPRDAIFERVLPFVFLFCCIGLAGIAVAWVVLSGEHRL